MPVTQKQLDNLEKGRATRFTKENASEMGKRGAPKSQIARRRNRSMAQLAQMIAEHRVLDEKDLKELEDLGISERDRKNLALVVAAVFHNAKAGSVAAFEKWEQMMERAEAEANGVLDSDHNRALALMRARYLPNISSNFGAISVFARSQAARMHSVLAALFDKPIRDEL